MRQRTLELRGRARAATAFLEAGEATGLAAEDGTGANDVAERRARQQPGEPERLDHLIVRGAASERLALDGHGADDEDVREHHCSTAAAPNG